MLKDKFNRKADYLRLAVTDRCNLRCRYCMPAEGIDFSARNDLLSYEEIINLARIFKNLGTTKLRLTGGEPFSRKDFPKLLQELATIYDQLYITTNAVLIEKHIDFMIKIGVKGLNISLDTLQKEKFAFITRRDEFDKVMSNILLCKRKGLPLKINAVVMKGINDEEIIDFISFGMEYDIDIRFIEAMPFNETDGNIDQFMDINSIQNVIESKHEVTKVISEASSSSVQYKIGNYTFSIIPAYSRLLCNSCNRMRLTPKGDFLTCLYAVEGISLRDILRTGAGESEISEHISKAIFGKKASGIVEENDRPDTIFSSMTTIGG